MIQVPKNLIAFSTDIGKKGIDDNLVVLLSGTPQRIYHDICDIIDGGDEFLKLNKMIHLLLLLQLFLEQKKLQIKR